MALVDLKSDLSWYGKKAPGFSPSKDTTDTKFINDGNSPAVLITGYTNSGEILSPVSKMAADSFRIDDVAFSDRGNASRKAQLGAGSPFPGGQHKFDITRTGFNFQNKYEDNYGIKFKNAGLADTYTANSPIDDMYSKFNLRDDATPNTYIKHPLILRGIQKENRSDPQRFGIPLGPGLGGYFDIPRGGIVTAAERTLLDTARIGKFLASPAGIGFLAKQFGYQLMNPKGETRIYDPLSLVSIAPGVRADRHLNPGGVLGGLISALSKKGSVVGASNDAKSSIFQIYKESGKENDLRTGLGTGAKIESISSRIGGPGSILGIGGTTLRKRSDIQDSTTLESQRSWNDIAYKRPGFDRSEIHRYDKDKSYEDYPDTESHFTNGEVGIPFEGGGINEGKDDSGTPNEGRTKYKTLPYESLRSEAKTRFDKQNTDRDFRSEEDYKKEAGETTLEKKIDEDGAFGDQEKGGGFSKRNDTLNQQDFTNYETNTYDDLPERQPFSTTTNDFRTKEEYKKEAGQTALEKKLDEPLANGDPFEGGGKNSSKENGSEQAQKGREYETLSYEELDQAAKSQKDNPGSKTNYNFKDKRRNSQAKGVDKDSNVEKLSKGEGWISDDPKGDRQGGGYANEPNDRASKVLGSYKRMSYGSIPSSRIAKDVRSHNDFRNAGQSQSKKIGWKGKKIDEINDSVDEGLVPFKIGGVKFRAYIGSFNEAFAPGWDGQADQGRADARYLYSSYERTLSLDFMCPIFNESERATIWSNLQKLAHQTMPVYKSSGFTGTVSKFTMGDMYKDLECIITDLSYDWDNETPWEIEKGKQAPFYTNVSLSLTVLDSKPQSGMRVYQNI